MERIKPETLTGPRSYFTDFDPRIVERTVNLSQLKVHAERKLKLLLLIKSKIVCAASHLATEFTYEILKENPRLLTEGHIVPALRIDKENISELFDKIDLENKDEILNYYDHHIKYVVDWMLEENSGWFRERFIEEITNPKSLIREQLSKFSLNRFSSTVIDDFEMAFNKNETIDRNKIEILAKDLIPEQKKLLLNFRELIYHLSGARVVNCESSLPQENYIDYDIADLSGKRTKLSEEQILFKLFIELAFETIQRRIIPYELLDWLSFDDILSIKKPLLESNFQSKYDSLISMVIRSIKQEYNKLFFNLNELEDIRSSLEATFNEIFEKELPFFLKRRKNEQIKELGSVASSMALGALGFIPGIGQVASGASILKESPALLFNIRQSFASRKAVNDLGFYLNNKENILRQYIEKTSLSEQATMLDMVDLFSKILGEKIKL